MKIITGTRLVLDEPKERFVIQVIGSFKGENKYKQLREVVEGVVDSENSIIYLDIRKASEIDLSACNEFIHSHYQLSQVNKELILVYDKEHQAQVWIENAGLDKFMKLAVTHI